MKAHFAVVRCMLLASLAGIFAIAALPHGVEGERRFTRET